MFRFFQHQPRQYKGFLLAQEKVYIHKQEGYNQHRLLFSKSHPGYKEIIHPLTGQTNENKKGCVWIHEYNEDRSVWKEIVSNDTP